MIYVHIDIFNVHYHPQSPTKILQRFHPAFSNILVALWTKIHCCYLKCPLCLKSVLTVATKHPALYSVQARAALPLHPVPSMKARNQSQIIRRQHPEPGQRALINLIQLWIL